MNVLVIDGQGGGLGRQLVAAISAACPEARLTAVGTNSLATSAMLKAGTVRRRHRRERRGRELPHRGYHRGAHRHCDR